MAIEKDGTAQLPLPDRIDVRLDQLFYQDITPVLREMSPYYEDFIAYLRDPGGKAEAYRSYLLADATITEQTVFRAASILAARRFGIGYDEARNLVPFMDLQPSPEEAADLVLANYLDMAATGEVYPIYAIIDHVGRIVVIEGLHRLSINIANGHTTCPVNILRRDPEWLAFLSFFTDQGSTLYKNPKSLYHRIDHPDFADWTVLREDRSSAIISYLKEHRPDAVRGVDIGSMIGFYSHELARAGYEVTAIEKEADYAGALRRLSRLYGVYVDVAETDIYDFDFSGPQFDFAVALSIIYHLYRNDKQRCQAFVDDLKTRIPLFFVDTEARTGILPESALRELFAGYEFELLHRGPDDREIFAIRRPELISV